MYPSSVKYVRPDTTYRIAVWTAGDGMAAQRVCPRRRSEKRTGRRLVQDPAAAGALE